jgi:hypothetical protein
MPKYRVLYVPRGSWECVVDAADAAEAATAAETAFYAECDHDGDWDPGKPCLVSDDTAVTHTGEAATAAFYADGEWDPGKPCDAEAAFRAKFARAMAMMDGPPIVVLDDPAPRAKRVSLDDLRPPTPDADSCIGSHRP